MALANQRMCWSISSQTVCRLLWAVPLSTHLFSSLDWVTLSRAHTHAVPDSSHFSVLIHFLLSPGSSLRAGQGLSSLYYQSPDTGPYPSTHTSILHRFMNQLLWARHKDQPHTAQSLGVYSLVGGTDMDNGHSGMKYSGWYNRRWYHFGEPKERGHFHLEGG